MHEPPAATPEPEPTASPRLQLQDEPGTLDHAAGTQGGEGNPECAVMPSANGPPPLASSMDAQDPSPSTQPAHSNQAAGLAVGSESGGAPNTGMGQEDPVPPKDVVSTKSEPQEVEQHADAEQAGQAEHMAPSDRSLHDVDMTATVHTSDSQGTKRQQDSFAFRPTRPRTKGLHRPRALLGLSAAGADEGMLGHTSTSGLDSLACAAAWELGDEDVAGHDMMGHSSGRHGSPRHDSEAGGGDYLDDDDGLDGEYDEGEGEEDQDGELSPYGTGPAAQGGSGGGRGSSGKRAGPRRGGAPRPRDPSAESAAEESGLVYAATSGRPDLDSCPPDMFEADLVGFLTARGERQLAAHVREKRITCNSLPLDIYGLYREVVKRGGYIANERYDDKGSRWTGTINFAGDIFPRLKNWTANNRATSVGSQLLNNYRKFLLAYERAYARWDLPNTDLAQHQRQVAAAFGADAAAAAASIVAMSIATGRKSAAWSDQPDAGVHNSSGNAMPAPPSRRSSASGAAGHAGSKRTAAAMATPTLAPPPEPAWQPAPTVGYASDAGRVGEPGYDDETSGMQSGGAGGVVQPGIGHRLSSNWAGLDTAGAEPGLGSAGALAGGGSAHTGSKRRRQTSASADGTPVSVLPLNKTSASQPSVRRVQQLQQQWGTAQMNLYMTGQQWWRPGQVVLVQDPHQPALQWALMVADLTDLPLEVADGGRLPPPPAHLPLSLPHKLLDANPHSKLEEVTPVLLLGSNAIGWVDRLSCRPLNPTTLQAAMSSVLHRLPGGGEQELACMRGLKLAIELSMQSDIGPASGAATPAAYAGVSPSHAAELITCMQSASVQHAAKRLLDLEGAIARAALASQTNMYWNTWRDTVTKANTAAALTFPLLALYQQLRPAYLTLPQEALWPELLTLLGLGPPPGAANASGNAMLMPFPDATCLGVDMAIGLMHSSIDWMAMKRCWNELLTGNPSPTMVGGMTTPLATPAGPWPAPGLPTPQGLTNMTPLANTPISVVDRTARVVGGPGDAARRPLPPVGPTAPPSTSHVGASFSSRMSSQMSAGGLPPRPPPVRVSSMSGGPTAGPPGLSPTAQQVQNMAAAPALSPLRVVPGPPASNAVDNKPVDMGVVHMGVPPVQPGSARAVGEGGNNNKGGSSSRVGSPLAGASDPLPAINTAATGTGGGSTGVSGVPTATTPLASPGAQPGTLVLSTGQPAAQQMSSSDAQLPPTIDAIPLDLSAPVPSTGGQAFGTPGLGSNGFSVGPMGAVVMGLGQPGNSVAMGNLNLMSPGSQNNQQPRAMHLAAGQEVPQPGGIVVKPTDGQGITSPPAGSTTMLTTPLGAVPAQQPIVVRDQNMGVAGEGGVMHGGMGHQWGALNSMDNNSMLSPQHHMTMMHKQPPVPMLQLSNPPGQAAMRMPAPGAFNNSQVSR